MQRRAGEPRRRMPCWGIITDVLQLDSWWTRLAAYFATSFRLDAILIYVPLVLLAALIVESVAVGHRNSTLANLGKVSRADWILYLVQQFNLSILLGYAATLGVVYILFRELNGVAGGLIPVEFRITSAIAFFLATDCLGYWYHRLAHRFPALWELHHVHHSAPDFNIVNAFRSHPVETVISRLFVAIPVAALFLPETSSLGAGVLAYLVLIKLLNLLQHSKIRSDFGWLGKIVVSPAHHRIHHSTNPDHFDRNFGNSFIIWDKLFGTYCTAPRNEIDAIEIGLDDYDRKAGVAPYLWRSYNRFVRAAALAPVRLFGRIPPWRLARSARPTDGTGRNCETRH